MTNISVCEDCELECNEITRKETQVSEQFGNVQSDTCVYVVSDCCGANVLHISEEDYDNRDVPCY